MTAKDRWTALLTGLTVSLAMTGCTMAKPALQETRELELDVEPGSLFEIDAGAGSLSLRGDAKTTAARVEAAIYQVRPHEDYELTLESDGEGGARLRSHTRSGPGMGRDHIDLSIHVPESLQVRIKDGSGSIRVSDLRGRLDIDDGSGSIRVASIEADVFIDGGSGSVDLQDTAGNVFVDDGSGSITVRNSGGDVTIDDGSGSITVRDTAGTVTVTDGSGSITVDGAVDFELLEDGSGSVNLDNIRSRESVQD